MSSFSELHLRLMVRAVRPSRCVRHALRPCVRHALRPCVRHALRPCVRHALRPCVRHALRPCVRRSALPRLSDPTPTCAVAPRVTRAA